IDFSNKATQRIELDYNKIWKSMKHMEDESELLILNEWAQHDNPIQHANHIKTCTLEVINNTCYSEKVINGVASVVHTRYKYTYKYTGTIWYQFKGHIWSK